MQAPNTRDLLLRVSDESSVRRLLGLKDSVNAFSRNDGLILIGEDEGRILAIKDDDVDLLAEVSKTIHDVRLCRLIAFRQVRIQQADPDILAGVTLRAGMVECDELGGE